MKIKKCMQIIKVQITIATTILMTVLVIKIITLIIVIETNQVIIAII